MKNQEVFEGGRGVDKPGETWEKKFLDISLAEHEGIVVHPQATRSFSDEFGGAIQGLNFLLLSCQNHPSMTISIANT